MVLESLITFYSGYFKLEVESPFYDAEVRLPGEDVEIFQMAMYYLHNRRFFDCEANPSPIITFDKLTDLYAFGVKRMMPLIQNVAADHFADKIKLDKALPDRWSLEYMWERTEAGAPLRRMVVDLVREICIPNGHRHYVWNELVGGQSRDSERLWGVIKELQESDNKIRISLKTKLRLQACEWHKHEQGVFCEGSEEARQPVRMPNRKRRLVFLPEDDSLTGFDDL